jgi:hypothetical protein
VDSFLTSLLQDDLSCKIANSVAACIRENPKFISMNELEFMKFIKESSTDVDVSRAAWEHALRTTATTYRQKYRKFAEMLATSPEEIVQGAFRGTSDGLRTEK